MGTISSSNAFLAQPASDVLYIMVKEAEQFERIPGPEITTTAVVVDEQGQRQVSRRVKAGLWNGINVVFQFWPGGEGE